MKNGVQATYRDEEGTYVWAPSSQDRRKPYIKMYIPEEDPLDGAKTYYGDKTFVYNKTSDQWHETKDQGE